MKRTVCILLVLLFLLAGCGKQGSADAYSLREGRYAVSESSSVAAPYILLREGRYTVVNDVAVSYQPGGTVQRDGEKLVLQGKFAGEEYCYTFTLIADDTLRFERGRSDLPDSLPEWEDGMIFTRAGDIAAEDEYGITDKEQLDSRQAALMEQYPAYFGLNAANGLDVIVWQTAQDKYEFGILEHADTPRGSDDEELLGLKGVTAEQMRVILSTYPVGGDRVQILPWQNPISSYLPEYLIDSGGEEMSAKKEAYIETICGMLFG